MDLSQFVLVVQTVFVKDESFIILESFHLSAACHQQICRVERDNPYGGFCVCYFLQCFVLLLFYEYFSSFCDIDTLLCGFSL